MQIRKKIKPSSILILLLIFTTYKCSLSQQFIRPVVNIEAEDVFPNKQNVFTNHEEYLCSYPEEENSFYKAYVTKHFVFYQNEKDGVRIDARVLADSVSAKRYLNFHFMSYTHPNIHSFKDSIPVVGDISYFKGRVFLRDNIFIKISGVSDIEKEKRTTQIAKAIDKRILNTPKIKVTGNMGPVIKRFEIAQKEVRNLSKTRLFIDVDEPNGKELECSWKFNSTIGNPTRYGKVVKDEMGHYYYVADPPQHTGWSFELTLIIKNEYGFGAESTIVVKIVE